MTMHQCPKCELRFSWATELDDHCRTDHPEFEHGYPVRPLADHVPVEPPPVDEATRRALDAQRTSKIVATWWSER
ncbi:MAG TPA: hypothetical protein VHC23_03820 [Jatrophihabitans sp.]|jgi:hypothetical protein|nr:hypothetical protein [Jatrophihabitans sp.]